MKELLISFAKQYEWKGKSLLLALSGGVDSMTLFHLLLRYHKELGCHFAAAHVDHGWRKESALEAEEIKKIAADNQTELFQIRLKNQDQNNLEKNARDLRYAFFKKVIEEKKFDGLILAHHLDDLAETVLKRVFEGASLPFLGGMRPFDKEKGYLTYRPFLSLQKQTIASWAEANQISFFEDKTNQDPHFLRSRLRQNLIPYLNKKFQKNIEGPLSQIAEESFMLRDYLHQKALPYLNLFKETPWGHYADFSEMELHFVEYRFLLQMIGKRYNLHFTYHELKQFARWLMQKRPNKEYRKKSTTLYFDRGHVLLQQHEIPRIKIVLQEGDFKEKNWKISYRPYQGEKILDHWQHWIDGKMMTKIPKGKYEVTFAEPGLSLRENTLYTKLAKMGIPSFLRAHFPIVIEESGFIIPLGTEKNDKETMLLKIELIK